MVKINIIYVYFTAIKKRNKKKNEYFFPLLLNIHQANHECQNRHTICAHSMKNQREKYLVSYTITLMASQI